MDEPQQMAQVPQIRMDEFNRFMADMNDVLELLEHDWLGEKWDARKGKWKKHSPPLMNSKGVHILISQIRLRACKNTFISNLSEDKIEARVDNLLKNLNDHLFFHGDEYDINPEVAPLIVGSVGDIVEIALNRAKDHGERDYYGKTSYDIHRTDHSDHGGSLGSIPIIGRFTRGGRREVI